MGLIQAPVSLFWDYINERHAIYLRRRAEQPKPWTLDPILRDYKFTNVFRELDRGTTWLREHFLEPYWDDDLSLLAFNICWYRMFNWWGTGALLGWRRMWEPVEIKRILNYALDRGEQVFTGAHIVYSPPGRPKVDAIVDVCRDLYHLCVAADALVTCAREEKSMERVYEGLKTVHCVGGFMAHEMVQDMRHTRLLSGAKDINTWTNLGPGAKRGLQRLGLPAKNQAEGQASMVALLDRSRETLGKHVLEFSIPWELHSIEFCLCEFDKYCRVKFGEGEPRSKYPGAA